MEEQGQMVAVVDDDPSLRRSVRNLLASVGFRVETFVSAEEFLQSARLDLTGCVVLDLRMGGMNGLDLLRHLRADGNLVPVVVLTAHGDSDLRDQALQGGALAFLSKPFHADVLLDAVKTAMYPQS